MLGKTLLEILKESKYTTVLSGFGMLLESGYPEIRDGEVSYDIELKYGYSVEEIFSSSFYSTRKEQFYEFYREEILKSLEKPPGKCFYEMAELEEKGLFQSIITRRIYRLPQRAGCKNVINLHGNVYDNYCPHCGKEYPVDYIMQSKRIPLCVTCSTPVRPRICLFGEMVDNRVITDAAEEVRKADTLLVLGSNLNAYLCSQLIDYYEGGKLVLINQEEHFSDKFADVVVHKSTEDALGEILKELGE